jgi:tetratricopeptide (TPR) repeat protein
MWRLRRLVLPSFWLFWSILGNNGLAADVPRSSEEIYRQALRSTAWVRVYQDNKLAKMGTGFLVDRFRKLLITNQHVVDNHEWVEVVFPLYQGGEAIADKKNYIRYDRPIRGWIIATDPKRDIAVIELEVVPHAATPLKLAADSSCPGERLHLIGNPGTSALLWAYNAGTVHQVSFRKLEDRRHGRTLEALLVEIRTRTSVIPGYSGGPAVNERGELAGIATMSNAAADWAWCVDITEVRDVVRLVMDYPKAAGRLLNPHAPLDYQEREAYYRAHGPADHAIAHYSEILGHDPKNTDAYFHRGAAFARRGEWEQAVADFTAALRLDPENGRVYYNRALAHSQMDAYDQALADFKETLRLDPKNALAYFDRGLLRSRKWVHDLALADFDQALQLESHESEPNRERGPVDKGKGEGESAKPNYAKLLLPDPSHAAAYNTVAWVWATSPDANRRDGKRALEFATKACELSGWKNANYLSTLAAAYAERGDFKQAVARQNRAVDLAAGEEKEHLRARLQLYQSEKPFHEK